MTSLSLLGKGKAEKRRRKESVPAEMGIDKSSDNS
jgi:hypothetical protein